MKVVNDYLSMRLGYEIEEEDYNKIKATVNYLKDNGFTDKEILKLLININIDLPEDIEMTGIEKAIVICEQLPEELWENSLLKKDAYYYNNRLHLTSKAPIWDPKTFKTISEPFYLEMIIKFSMEDLLEMYYVECRIPLGLRNKERDKGAFKHLLTKYNNLKAEALDYILLMIDLASNDKELDFLSNPFELENYSKQAFIILEDIVEESTLNKSNKIIWRK